MIATLLAAALTAHAAPTDPADAPAAVVSVRALPPRRTAVRLYPRRRYLDLSVDRRCVVDVRLGARGVPERITPVDCSEALFAWTHRRVRRDRWPKDTPEGTVVRMPVVYRAPADAAELDDPSYFRRRAGETCSLRVDVAPDGTATLAGESLPCAPALAPLPPTPDRLLKPPTPEVCVVTFVLVDGEVRGLDRFRCEFAARQAIPAVLDAWAWPTFDAPRPYTVQVRWQIDRPDGWTSR